MAKSLSYNVSVYRFNAFKLMITHIRFTLCHMEACFRHGIMNFKKKVTLDFYLTILKKQNSDFYELTSCDSIFGFHTKIATF